MHELSIAQALVEQVQSQALAHGAVRVPLITVRVGPLCGVEPALLRRAFEVARLTQATTAGAELIVEQSDIRVKCRDCHNESAGSTNNLLCRHCGSRRTDLTQGDELLLLQIELEIADVVTAGDHLAQPLGEDFCNV
jgi:hydrogenase nickel incorporation protein HypA/HybF